MGGGGWRVQGSCRNPRTQGSLRFLAESGGRFHSDVRSDDDVNLGPSSTESFKISNVGFSPTFMFNSTLKRQDLFQNVETSKGMSKFLGVDVDVQFSFKSRFHIGAVELKTLTSTAEF